jgi:hypothetical protein
MKLWSCELLFSALQVEVDFHRAHYNATLTAPPVLAGTGALTVISSSESGARWWTQLLGLEGPDHFPSFRTSHQERFRDQSPVLALLLLDPVALHTF